MNPGRPKKQPGLYQEELQHFYGARYGTTVLDPARPLFDVTLLGLGPDGHTASLFPGSAALDERKAWTTAVVGVKSEARVSLTYPGIEASAAILFLVAGRGKTRCSGRCPWQGHGAARRAPQDECAHPLVRRSCRGIRERRSRRHKGRRGAGNLNFGIKRDRDKSGLTTYSGAFQVSPGDTRRWMTRH